MAAALPGSVQGLGLPAEPTPGAFVGVADSQGRPGRASQAARLTSSATASSRRGGARVIKTDEAIRFSGCEAIASLQREGWGAEWNVGSGQRVHATWTQTLSRGAWVFLLLTRWRGHPTAPESPAQLRKGLGCPWGRAGVYQVTWLQGGTQ